MDHAANNTEKLWMIEWDEARDSVCAGGLEGMKDEGFSWSVYVLGQAEGRFGRKS